MRNETVFLGEQQAFGITDLPKSLADAYAKALVLEEYVMAKLQELSEAAAIASDWSVVSFLQPFLKVGVESIYDLTTWKNQLARLAMDQAGMYAFDKERGG
jgi:ferritin